MTNEDILNTTVNELTERLGKTEMERASFKAQAVLLLQENNNLKAKIDKLTKKDDDAPQSTDPQLTSPEPKQDPQA